MSNEFNNEGKQPSDSNKSANFYATPNQQPSAKKSKKPVILAITGIVVIALIATAVYCLALKKTTSPSTAVAKSMSQLKTQFSEKELGTNPMQSDLGLQELSEAITEKGSQIDFSLSIEQLPELLTGGVDLAGSGINFSSINDLKTSQQSFTVGANALGMNVFTANLYYGKDMLAVWSDALLKDEYVCVDFNELKKLVESDEDTFGMISNMLDMDSSKMMTDVLDYQQYCAKTLPDYFTKFSKQWDVKEVSNTKSVQVGSDKKKCTTYEISISPEELQNFIKDYSDYLLKYDYDNNDYFNQIDAALLETGEDSFKDSLEILFEEMLASMKEEMTDDIQFKLYIDSNNKLLGMSYEKTFEDVDVSFSLLFGGKNPGQDIYMTAKLKDEVDDYVNLDLSCVTTTEKKVTTTTTTINADFDIESEAHKVALTLSSDYDSDDHSFKEKAKIDFDSQIVNITGKGKYTNIKKGSGYETELESLKLSMLGIEAEFSGDMYFGIPKDDVVKPTGTKNDIVTMTDEERTTLFEKIESNPFVQTLISLYEDYAGGAIIE